VAGGSGYFAGQAPLRPRRRQRDRDEPRASGRRTGLRAPADRAGRDDRAEYRSSRPLPVVARAAFRKRHGVADLHLHKLHEPLVIAWRRVLAIEVIDDLGQVAGQLLAFGFGHAAPPQQGSAFPDTGQNTLMLPMCALSAPRQRKPLESHDLDTTARVHHAARRGGGDVAACGESAASGSKASDRSPKGTPKELINKLAGALDKALDDSSVRKRLADLGGSIPAKQERTPTSFARLVKTEVARWSPILKAASLTTQ
jgi:hypothetical protein